MYAQCPQEGLRDAGSQRVREDFWASDTVPRNLVKQLRQAILRSKGIDHFEEWELIEIGVAGANSPDAVFAHKNGGVRVVEQIAGEVRQLQNNLLGDVGVRVDQHIGVNGEH